MCGQWGEGGVTRRLSAGSIQEELSLDTLRSTVDGMLAFSPSVTLFGGEPLLYKDCIGLIRHIKSRGMHCLVITNGFLVKDYAEELVASRLDELNVSLDGSGQTHDRIRGMPGLFDKIMSGLEALKKIKMADGRKRPFVNIQCTINRDNYRTLEEMIDVARRAGADSLTFHNLIFTNKEVLGRQQKFDDILQCSSDDWKGFDFEPGIDPMALREIMTRILSRKYSFHVDFYPNFPPAALASYYRDPCFIPSGYSPRCLSPWIAAYVFPDGEVRPCLNCTYSYGNIKDAPMAEIWNSPEALKYRRILRENKTFPVCARCTELYRY
jgi:radical SAM protein with 4Fe4S-binding SPASM domain